MSDFYLITLIVLDVSMTLNIIARTVWRVNWTNYMWNPCLKHGKSFPFTLCVWMRCPSTFAPPPIYTPHYHVITLVEYIDRNVLSWFGYSQYISRQGWAAEKLSHVCLAQWIRSHTRKEIYRFNSTQKCLEKNIFCRLSIKIRRIIIKFDLFLISKCRF